MYKRSVMVIIGLIILCSLLGLAFRSGSSRSAAKADKVAVIYVEGVIAGGRGQGGLFSESGGTDHTIKLLHEAGNDPAVKAVVLRINSPGGSAAASQEVGEEIKKLRGKGKKVVTSMADVAASGGYWLAACTDKIYANPTTMTGSIGVYVPYTNWEELYKKVGIYQEKIKSGAHKDILSPERSMTKEEREIIQAMVNDIYEQFVAVVAEGRNMDPADVRKLADGRIFTGNQAKQLGLVDELGNMYDAVDEAARLAGISGKAEIADYGKSSPLQMLLGANEEAGSQLEQVIMKQAANMLRSWLVPQAGPDKWQVR